MRTIIPSVSFTFHTDISLPNLLLVSVMLTVLSAIADHTCISNHALLHRAKASLQHGIRTSSHWHDRMAHTGPRLD